MVLRVERVLARWESSHQSLTPVSMDARLMICISRTRESDGVSASLLDAPIRPIPFRARVRPILVKQQSICSATSSGIQSMLRFASRYRRERIGCVCCRDLVVIIWAIVTKWFAMYLLGAQSTRYDRLVISSLLRICSTNTKESSLCVRTLQKSCCLIKRVTTCLRKFAVEEVLIPSHGYAKTFRGKSGANLIECSVGCQL